jgi:hypothetical protein
MQSVFTIDVTEANAHENELEEDEDDEEEAIDDGHAGVMNQRVNGCLFAIRMHDAVVNWNSSNNNGTA